MNFRMVPDDEIDEVRALLEEHQLPFHEQPSSRFGFGHGGFWILDPQRYDEARSLLDDYQQQRSEKARSEWQAAQGEGRGSGLIAAFRQRPLAMMLVVFAVIGILLVTVVMPFLLLRS